jgi:hypothetical protein
VRSSAATLVWRELRGLFQLAGQRQQLEAVGHRRSPDAQQAVPRPAAWAAVSMVGGSAVASSSTRK